MLAYRPASWPKMSQAVIAPSSVVSAPSASTGGAPVPEGLFWTALAGAASYAAIRTGMRDKGFTKYVGWAGGVAAGLAALLGLAGIVAPNTVRGFPVRWYYS